MCENNEKLFTIETTEDENEEMTYIEDDSVSEQELQELSKEIGAEQETYSKYDADMLWTADVMNRYHNSNLAVSKAAEEEIFLKYEPFVHRCIRKRFASYAVKPDIYEVLRQEGSLGLLMGLKHFDATKGFRISTYCYKYIIGYMSKGLSREFLGTTPHYSSQINKINKAEKHFQSEGRSFTMMDIASYTGMSMEATMSAYRERNGISAVHYQAAEGDMEMPSRDLTPEEQVILNETSGIVRNAIEKLRASGRDDLYMVIVLRYLCSPRYSITATAKRLGCSPDMVKQLDLEARHILRHDKQVASLRPDKVAKHTRMADKVSASTVPEEYASLMLDDLMASFESEGMVEVALA